MKKLIKVLAGLTFLVSINAWAITPDDVMRLCGVAGNCATELAQGLGSGSLDFTTDPWTILADTSDAADTKSVTICGGGAAAVTRGGCVTVAGNEESTPGEIFLESGSISTADIFYKVASADGSHRFYNNDVATVDISSAGNILLRTGEVTFNTGGLYVRAGVYVPTPVATPVLGTNLVKPGLNVIPTAAANTAMWLGASTPVAGDQFMIYNNAGAAVRIKGAGAAVINGGTAGKYIEMGIGSYMECKTLTTAIQQCPFYTVNGVVAAMPTPA